MGFEGYIKDALESAISDFSLDQEYLNPGNSVVVTSDDFKKWESSRRRQDDEYIRNSKIKTRHLFEPIQAAAPEYSGPQGKNWSGKEARQAILSAVNEYRISNTSRNARKIWAADDSAEIEKIKKADWNDVPGMIVNLNEVGNAIGMYGKLVLKQTAQITDLAAKGTSETAINEERFKLHIAVLDDLKNKVESEGLIEEMLTADNKTLISNWNIYFAALQMSTIDRHQRVYDNDPRAEERKAGLNGYKDILDRIQAVRPELEARMELLASGFSEKFDIEKISEMPTGQLKSIMEEANKNTELFSWEKQKFVEYNPFAQALKLNQERLKRQKKEIAETLFNKDAELQASDIDGKPGDLDELLQSGLPVIISAKTDKENTWFVFRDGASVFYGDEAAAKFREKRNAALEKKPSGLGWLWDSFCSAVGREDWRTQAAKEYYKYERMLDGHPDIEAKLNDPSKAKPAETLARNNKKKIVQDENAAQNQVTAEKEKQLSSEGKPERDSQIIKEEKPEQKNQDVKEEKTKQENLTEQNKEHAKETLPLTKGKPSPKEIPVPKDVVKKYLNDKLEWQKNYLELGRVGSYLMLKSLSKAMDGDEKEIDFLLNANYKSEIDQLIDERTKLAEATTEYRDTIAKLKKENQIKEIPFKDLIPEVDKLSETDAFKLTVPGKTKDEYTSELYYSVNKMDKDLREKFTSLSGDLCKQAEDLLSKNEMTRGDLCRAAIITQIVLDIRQGIDRSKDMIGLDAEFEALVKFVGKDVNYSEKLNDYIENRANVIEPTAVFEKFNPNWAPVKKGVPRLITMESGELKDILTAMLKGDAKEEQTKNYYVVNNNNRLGEMLSKNDITKCAEQHNNLKSVGLTEADDIAVQGYIDELSTEFNNRGAIDELYLKSAELTDRADSLSYIKMISSLNAVRGTYSSIANGEAVTDEEFKHLRNITDQVKNDRNALEKKREVLSKTLCVCNNFTNMGRKMLKDALSGKPTPALDAELDEKLKDYANEMKKMNEQNKPEIGDKKNTEHIADASKKVAHII